VAQLAVDLEQRTLGALDHQQAQRAEAQGLAADFGADAPAGAGHHHALSGEEALQFRRVEVDRGTPEKVRRNRLRPAVRGAYRAKDWRAGETGSEAVDDAAHRWVYRPGRQNAFNGSRTCDLPIDFAARRTT
jgi:hypothetical protein